VGLPARRHFLHAAWSISSTSVLATFGSGRSTLPIRR
jgi:hypothetical protein